MEVHCIEATDKIDIHMNLHSDGVKYLDLFDDVPTVVLDGARPPLSNNWTSREASAFCEPLRPYWSATVSRFFLFRYYNI
jgi:hypothetical protein